MNPIIKDKIAKTFRNVVIALTFTAVGALGYQVYKSEDKVVAYEIFEPQHQMDHLIDEYSGERTSKVEFSLQPVNLSFEERKNYQKEIKVEYYKDSDKENGCDDLRSRRLFIPFACMKEGDIYVKHFGDREIEVLINQDALPIKQRRDVLKILRLEEVIRK